MRTVAVRRAPWRARALAFAALLVLGAGSLPADAAIVVREKDANLDIAMRTRALLRAAGVQVTMSRTIDRTLQPHQRYGPPNNARADVFVSLHNNASSSRSARGSEVYRSMRRDGSATLGRLIVQELDDHVGNVRGSGLRTRRGRSGRDYYYQLRLTRMPAVIVESAFVSNPTEGRRLGRDAGFRQAIARAVADGILRYQRTLAVRTAPRLARGTVVEGPGLAPTEGGARALGGTRIALSWTGAPGSSAFRIYRDGRLIAVRTARLRDPVAQATMSMTDVWAAPGQRYRYEIRSVTEAAPGVFAESLPLSVEARTPAISVFLDAGHGGRDPGAVLRS